MAHLFNARHNAGPALSFSGPFYAIPTSEARVEVTKVASLRRNALTDPEYLRALLRALTYVARHSNWTEDDALNHASQARPYAGTFAHALWHPMTNRVILMTINALAHKSVAQNETALQRQRARGIVDRNTSEASLRANSMGASDLYPLSTVVQFSPSARSAAQQLRTRHCSERGLTILVAVHPSSE